MPLPALLSYIEITVISFAVNVIPAFVPPTWLVLSFYKINNPMLNVAAITFFGVIGSVVGRYLMYVYSKFFANYLPKKEEKNLSYFKKFVAGNEFNLSVGTFLYALTPLPSNFLFISLGLSKTNIKPALLGFALGRFLSYFTLITVSMRAYSYLSRYVSGSAMSIIVELLGLFFAILIMFVNWKNVYEKGRKFFKG